MKKIFLFAYLNKNLGDDLFVKIFIERYSNHRIYLYSINNYKETYYKYKNVKVIDGFIVKVINKIVKILKLKRYNIFNILKKKCDIFVYIGGSIFIQQNSIEEEKEKIYNIYNAINKDYYIIGSNFGPYKEEKYKHLYYEVFKLAKDVCFREEESYEEFKMLPTVRFASDIVFGLDTKNINKKNSNKVIFSIIDCETKNKEKYKEAYENKIIEMTKYFFDKGYEVTYMSFCEVEGDEKAIKRILAKIEVELAKKIKVYSYTGNIEEAINILADSKIIVGARFHANIIGLVLEKKIIPIAYSEKIINVLKKIKYEGKIIKLEEIGNMSMEDINKNLMCKTEIINDIIDSNRQFEKLDRIL